MSDFNCNDLNWEKCDGLIPAIVQDSTSGQVLMLGFMNEEALQLTLSTKKVTFFSRSRQSLWVKGETSGNYLNFIKIASDCDSDALLILANPEGPTCHLGTQSCFGDNDTGDWQILYKLEKIITQRAKDMPSDSYTASLLSSGINKITQKVGEEAVETVIAGLNEGDDELCNELADLFYHTLVLLKFRQLGVADVLKVLKVRLENDESNSS